MTPESQTNGPPQGKRASERERLLLAVDAGRTLTAELTVAGALDAALALAPGVGAEHGYILVLEGDDQAAFIGTVPGLVGMTEAQAREFARLLVTQGLERWVLETQQPALVVDSRSDPRWYTAPGHVEEEPARAVIAVPLLTAREQLSGVLAYTHSQPGSFDEEDVRVVELIGRFLANALENARLFEQMQAALAERERVEEALQQANEQLTTWVYELEQVNREMAVLGEMGELLQSCLTTEEAFAIIAHSAEQLFPGQAGLLGMISASRNLVEGVAVWGGAPASDRVFNPDDCWALRRGRVHVVDASRPGLFCRHVARAEVASTLCVPMIAQGEMLGLLHLQCPAAGEGGQGAVRVEPAQRLATALSEHVALALANLRLRETLRLQSIRDPLTDLFNRRYMEESLEREIRRAARSNRPIGVIMLDIDHFKQFNDAFGHAAGDTLLREIGAFLQAQIRGGDIGCRYGGEEFTLILPEASLRDTYHRAEQLREAVKELHVRYRGQPLRSVTLSMGVVAFPEHGSTAEALLQLADAALYRSKGAGRDRVVVADPQVEG